MPAALLSPLLLTAVSVTLLLVAEARGSVLGKWLTKPMASTGFVWLGLRADALSSSWGRAIFVGLCLCWLGDVLLIARDRRCFLSGLLSFLLGHAAFVVAFAIAGIHPAWTAAAALPLAAVAAVVLRWLWPHLSAAMRRPVVAYVVVITAMVAAAFGLAAADGPTGARLQVPVGATLFFTSDLCVARNRFVSPAFVNRLIGLPLYYAGVVLLALSAGA